MRFLLLTLIAIGIMASGCAKDLSFETGSPASLLPEIQEEEEILATPPPSTPSPTPTPPPSSSKPLSDAEIILDSHGENFQKSISSQLNAARYMEKSCTNLSSWMGWKDLPLKWCTYSTKGQNAEVLMLNPGPRRLTQWIQKACHDLAGNLSNCMDKTFKHILYQSGGQFPVAGVVIEDMDGNGKGNAYAFRNGVTIQVSAFSTATESKLTSAQVSRAFTDPALKTYTYGRPISLTREQLTAYGKKYGLDLPELGTSSQQRNIFNEVLGSLYQESWYSSQNHIIRAWVHSQKF